MVLGKKTYEVVSSLSPPPPSLSPPLAPPRATGRSPPPAAALSSNTLPPSPPLAGGRRALPGRRRWRRLVCSRAVEGWAGPLLPLGGGALREALVRRGWVSLVVVLGCWPRRGRHGCKVSGVLCARFGHSGPRWARAGSRWARAGRGSAAAVPAAGGGDDFFRLRTAAVRPAHCSSAAEALRAHLGPAGPVWAWCALAALSGRCLPLGGGGGSLPHGCEAAILG